jgi:quinol-cytochrome oxidoreductase complex cytochrome b subunit
MIITFLIAKIILGGYWLIFAPALFLPLGTVLLSPQVLRGIFGCVVFLLSVAFAALGMICLLTLTLPDAVTILVGLLAMWYLAAAITHLARRAGERGRQPQELRTAKASITR